LEKIFEFPTIRKFSEYINSLNKESHLNQAGYLFIEPVEKKEFYQLSSAQKRLYILNQLKKNSTSYNETTIQVVKENIDKEILHEVFQLLIKRHESLRTSIEIINGNPGQRIHHEMELEVEYYDINKMQHQSDSKEESILQPIIKNFTHPFDLSCIPLLRVGLIKITQNDCILMIDMHHIITDDFSVDILMKEFTYLCSPQFEKDTLPVLNLQYKDYAQWQNSEERKKRIQSQEKYWLNLFKNTIPVLDVPIDYPRIGSSREGMLGTIGFIISSKETNILRKLAISEDATIFMVFLAILNILLSKISGQETIIVGNVIAGRNHAGLENIIGMFANTLALINYPYRKMKFRDFLKDVRTRALEAFENQDYQFDDLVDHIVKGRDLNRNPIFDVIFSFISNKESNSLIQKQIPEENGEFIFQEGQHDSPTKFDLVFECIEESQYIHINFGYNRELYKKETVRTFAGYIIEIGRSIIKNSDIQLDNIKISHDFAEAKNNVIQSDEGDFNF
jgi:hypothetical protein